MITNRKTVLTGKNSGTGPEVLKIPAQKKTANMLIEIQGDKQAFLTEINTKISEFTAFERSGTDVPKCFE